MREDLVRILHDAAKEDVNYVFDTSGSVPADGNPHGLLFGRPSDPCQPGQGGTGEDSGPDATATLVTRTDSAFYAWVLYLGRTSGVALPGGFLFVVFSAQDEGWQPQGGRAADDVGGGVDEPVDKCGALTVEAGQAFLDSVGASPSHP